MRPFDGLTAKGKVTRLRGLALSAAARYGVDVARLTLVGESFNTLFRIRSGAGDSYLLRVGSPLRLHPPGSEQVEAAWLEALRRDTTIPVALVFRNLAGGVVTETVSPGVPERRTCMLFSWVPGRVLAEGLDPALAGQSGRLLAGLHAQASRSESIATEAVPVANRVLYWNDTPKLDTLVARHGSLFGEATERAQAAIASLWASLPHRPHLLHGDLTPTNIVRTRRGLVPIDFQDLVVGFDVQDVAISLFPYLRHGTGPTLIEAFRSGYDSVRPWPDPTVETLEALFAARRLLLLNLGLNLERPNIDVYVDQMAARITDWMRTA